MLYFKFKIPVKGVGQALIDRQGFEGQRCDKLHRIFCHDDMHIGVLFLQRLARFAALYAAIPPVTPKIIVFPVNIIHILSVCTLVFWTIFEQHSIWRKNCKPFLASVLYWGLW